MSESRRVQVEVCERIVKEGLSVRQVEKLCGQPKTKERKPKPEKDVHLREVEDDLTTYSAPGLSSVRAKAERERLSSATSRTRTSTA